MQSTKKSGMQSIKKESGIVWKFHYTLVTREIPRVHGLLQEAVEQGPASAKKTFASQML